MPAIAGQPWRALAKLVMSDANGHWTFTASTISHADIETASGSQTPWLGTAGSTLTIHLQWNKVGTPGFTPANVFLYSADVDRPITVFGSPWNPTITGDSGELTRTFYFDYYALAGFAYGSGSAPHVGMMELLILAPAGNGGFPSSEGVVYGNGLLPAGMSFDWARGYVRADAALVSDAVTDSWSGAAAGATLYFPFAPRTAPVLSGSRFGGDALTLTHLQGTSPIRSQILLGWPATPQALTWYQAANGVNGQGRINKDYSIGDVKVRYEFPADTFGGDRKIVWTPTGHAAGYGFIDEATIEHPTRLNVNPTISVGTLTFTDILYNHYPIDTATFSIKILDAGGNNVPLALPGLLGGYGLNVGSSDGNVHENIVAYTTDGSGLNTFTNYQIHPNGRSPWDLVGDRWFVRTVWSDMEGAQAQGNIFKVSRKLQPSTLGNGTINNQLYTATAPLAFNSSYPATIFDDEASECERICVAGYIYKARGELIGNVALNIASRRAAADTFYQLQSGSGATVAGKLDSPWWKLVNGPEDDYVTVLADAPIAAANQPRAGLVHIGNFAETSNIVAVSGGPLNDCCCCDCLDVTPYLIYPIYRFWPTKAVLNVSGIGGSAACQSRNGEFASTLKHAGATVLYYGTDAEPFWYIRLDWIGFSSSGWKVTVSDNIYPPSSAVSFELAFSGCPPTGGVVQNKSSATCDLTNLSASLSFNLECEYPHRLAPLNRVTFTKYSKLAPKYTFTAPVGPGTGTTKYLLYKNTSGRVIQASDNIVENSLYEESALTNNTLWQLFWVHDGWTFSTLSSVCDNPDTLNNQIILTLRFLGISSYHYAIAYGIAVDDFEPFGDTVLTKVYDCTSGGDPFYPGAPSTVTLSAACHE